MHQRLNSSDKMPFLALEEDKMEEEQKVKLPIIFEGKPLPTNKHHISYSEMVEWIECSWRHKLHHIDKIDLDKPSEHTEFGGIVHDAIEQYLIGKEPLNSEETGKKVIEALGKLPDFKDDPAEWALAVDPIFKELPGFLDLNFPNWSLVSAEHELMESIEKKDNRYFKGFIDCVIKYDFIDKRKKDPVVEERFLVLDWKTTSWGWTNNKKQDPIKQMQLVLYKHFWARKTNTPLEKVKCAWVLLKRVSKPGNYIELIPVSVGEKAVEKAMENVYKMIGSVEKKMFVKNRNSCKFCPYFGTEHCT